MSTSPGPEIDWETSDSKLSEFLASEEALSCPTGIVITGFVASTKAGVATTLQRFVAWKPLTRLPGQKGGYHSWCTLLVCVWATTDKIIVAFV